MTWFLSDETVDGLIGPGTRFDEILAVPSPRMAFSREIKHGTIYETYTLAYEEPDGGANSSYRGFLITLTYRGCGDIDVKVTVMNLGQPFGEPFQILPEQLSHDVSPPSVVKNAFARVAYLIAGEFERSGGEPSHGISDLRRRAIDK